MKARNIKHHDRNKDAVVDFELYMYDKVAAIAWLP